MENQMQLQKSFQIYLVFILASFSICLNAQSEELTIKVSGIKKNKGEVVCALFKTADGFPMDLNKPQTIWKAADGAEISCMFTDITAGNYAVSVAHDENGNKEVDTNFFGMPTEAWGVSNNIRPLMRAPRWQEAQFSIPAGEKQTISIQLEK
jgi:uncharacterized protein (DUF2141 family)